MVRQQEGAHVSSATSPWISSNRTDLFAGSRAYVHPRSFAIRRNTLSPLESTCAHSAHSAHSVQKCAIKNKERKMRNRTKKKSIVVEYEITSGAAFACLPRGTY